jgi:hypothetical protein
MANVVFRSCRYLRREITPFSRLIARAGSITSLSLQTRSEIPRWRERIVCSSVASSRNVFGHRVGGMENFLLFVLSSSFCTLVTGITLLLRPLFGMP